MKRPHLFKRKKHKTYGFDETFLFDRLQAVEAKMEGELPPEMRAAIYKWFENTRADDAIMANGERAQFRYMLVNAGAGLLNLGIAVVGHVWPSFIPAFVSYVMSLMAAKWWGLWAAKRELLWEHLPMPFLDPEFDMARLDRVWMERPE